MLYKLNNDGTISEAINAFDTWKRIALTEVQEYRISTVFLGIDHNFSGVGLPILFETMGFDTEGKEMFQKRACTLEKAQVMHLQGVIYVQNLLLS